MSLRICLLPYISLHNTSYILIINNSHAYHNHNFQSYIPPFHIRYRKTNVRQRSVYMSSKTKIVVLHMKEIIYTVVFLILAILMIALLVIMFGPKKDMETAATAQTTEPDKYMPGVYTTAIELNDNSFDVQVTVDSNHINSIELVNLSEATTAMYPLVEPSLENLATQIYATQSTDNITYEDDSKYTSMLLLEAIKSALAKATPES